MYKKCRYRPLVGRHSPFPPFEDLLRTALTDNNLSLRAFSRNAGVPVSLLARIMKGERPVPSSRIVCWADQLALTGEERSNFIDSAFWTSVPLRLRPWLEAKLGAKPPDQVPPEVLQRA